MVIINLERDQEVIEDYFDTIFIDLLLIPVKGKRLNIRVQKRKTKLLAIILYQKSE